MADRHLKAEAGGQIPLHGAGFRILGTRGPGAAGGGDERLRLADIEAARHHLLGQFHRIGGGEEGAGVSGGEAACAKQLLDAGWQREQAESVGDVAAALADGLAEGLLRQAELARQPLIAFRLLEGVEILPLQVLDQGGGEGRAVI